MFLLSRLAWPRRLQTHFSGARHVALLLLAFSAGCSNYAIPHHAYAPLFDRAGQVDIAASVGGNLGAGQPELVVEGHAAGSPVDAFVITGGVTASVIPGDRSSNHVDGELAVGVYLPREEHVRAELLVGSAAGFGTGQWYGEDTDSSLSGVFARPFLQGTIAGFYNDFFTFGGGLRVGATLVDMQVLLDPLDEGGDIARPGFRQAVHLDPFLTARFAVDITVLEVGFGTSVSLGDKEVSATANVWLNLALHLRFDLSDETAGHTSP